MEIGPTFIGAQPTTFSATFGGTGLDASSGGSSSSSGTYHGARGTGGREHDAISSARRGIDDAYKRATKNIPTIVKEAVAKAKGEVGTNPLPPVESLNREVGIYDKLIGEKTVEIKNLTPVAQEFNGGDPLLVSFNDIREKAKTTPAQSKYLVPMIVAMRLWDSSYKAGTQIKLLNEMITELTTQSAPAREALVVINKEALRLKDAQDRAARKEVPLIPPGVSLDNNMKLSKDLRTAAKLVIGGEEAIVYGLFYAKVKNGAEWDYKQGGRQYEEFGNFNYGATGTASGIPEQVLLRAAGMAQSQAGTSRQDFDKWWGNTPYGDDKVDQVWIKAGIEFAKSKGY